MAIAELSADLLAEPLEKDEKKKRYAIGAGKGLGVLASVALTAYLSTQQAISERPTRVEVRASASEVENRIDTVEDAIIDIRSKLYSLDAKVSEGFKDIKEELRYLRRK